MELAAAKHSCKTEVSVPGMALKGFVFKKVTVKAPHVCDITCEREKICQSYNYLIGEKSCELNTRIKEARPENFQSDDLCFYMGRVNDRTPLGSIPELPALSCYEIKLSEGKDSISKKYWLDPTNSGSSKLVYCNMNLGDRKGNTCGPVGVADNNTIPDARMTASSVFLLSDDFYASYLGRLNETRGRGGWCPKTKFDKNDYLQVDMGSVLSVCAVATQGGEVLSEWTTSYKLRLSIDGLTWNTYEETNKTKVFQGNSDQTSIVKHSLRTDFKARYVRFYPVSYQRWPCLRVEIYVFK